MKLPINGFYYLVLISVIYFWAGIIDLFIYRFAEPELLSFIYCCVLALPLFFPLQKLVNINPFWKQ